MISKMRSGKVMGLNVATWLSKHHEGYEQLRVDAYAQNSANRAKGSRQAQANKPKKVTLADYPRHIQAMIGYRELV